MDTERLAAIEAYWQEIYDLYYVPDVAEPPDTLHDAICHVDELVAEVKRLREQVASLEVRWSDVMRGLASL